MVMRPATRATDERDLQILHLLDHGDSGAPLTGAVVAQRMGMTRSAVLGLKSRTSGAAGKIPCRCRKKKNRDGGMPPRWWAGRS